MPSPGMFIHETIPKMTSESSGSGQSGKPLGRIIAYVDGFNLYFGISDAGLRAYLWLNVHALAQEMAGKLQVVGVTKYFTARISGAKRGDNSAFAVSKNAKRKRQDRYIQALETIPQLRFFYGQYRDEPITCNTCNRSWSNPKEKMTDVNIATEMLCDAFNNQCDTFLLISGDSDLVPPVQKILTTFPKKTVIAVSPPLRYSSELEQVSSDSMQIEHWHLRKSQLPKTVTGTTGFSLTKPASWN